MISATNMTPTLPLPASQTRTVRHSSPKAIASPSRDATYGPTIATSDATQSMVHSAATSSTGRNVSGTMA